jgi:superfamily II DNA or RNA helicase
MEFDLHDWQEDALDTWIQKEKKGIVEAVTGAGKTYLALAAIHYLYGESKKVRTIIVVPTIALQLQWKERIELLLPNFKVGLWGGGQCDSIGTHKIIVSVINTAVTQGEERLKTLGSLKEWKKFLIADECHRYVEAETFSRVRTEFYWDAVLAMTATIGSDQFNIPGFGEIIYTYDFPRAVADGLVPKFNVLNISIPLSESEKEKYDELSDTFSKRLDRVKEEYKDKLYNVPYGLFFRKLGQIVSQKPDDHISILALFKTMFERVAIAYMAYYKMKLAEELLEILAVHEKRKVIVFFERIASIDNLLEAIKISHSEEKFNASELVDKTLKGIGKSLKEKISDTWVGEIHSGLNQIERQERLNQFKSEQPAILLTCRMLDEGIDVPDIDAAILVASTKSKRQRIQRFGRVLRKSEKKPLIITLIVPETSEGRIIQDDEETFQGAADLHNANYYTAKEVVHKLLTEPGEIPEKEEFKPILPEEHWSRLVSFSNNAIITQRTEIKNRSDITLLLACPNSGRDFENLPKPITNPEISKKTINSLLRRLDKFKPSPGKAFLPNDIILDTIFFSIEGEVSQCSLPKSIKYYYKNNAAGKYVYFRNILNSDDEWDIHLLS